MPPVRIGDVLEHRLAAIAEARRLDGRDLEAAAQLVDDQGGQRLALDVLGDDQQRLARSGRPLEQRQQVLQVRELLLVDQDVGVFELGDHLLGVGDEVGREIAAVELHAFDDVELGLEALGFLDGDDAVLADLLHRLGDHLADRLVAVGRDGADLGDLRAGRDLLRRPLRSSITHSTARSMPRLRSIGFMPAATDLAPSRTIAWASTVAVVVPSPAMSLVRVATSRTIWAPMFSNLSESSISLATVTPSLVMRGAPKHLSSTTLRPLGPSVTLTAVGQNIDAAHHARAGVAAKTDFLGCHGACSLFLMPGRLVGGCYAAFFLATAMVRASMTPMMSDFVHDQEILAVELDLGAGPLAEQDAVALLDVERHQRAPLVAGARADGDDLAFHRLFLGGVGNDDAALGLAFFFDARMTTRSCSGRNFMAVLSNCRGFRARAPSARNATDS